MPSEFANGNVRMWPREWGREGERGEGPPIHLGSGMLQAWSGVYHFSPASIQLANQNGDGSELIPTETLAVLLSRLVTRAMDAEEPGRCATR